MGFLFVVVLDGSEDWDDLHRIWPITGRVNDFHIPFLFLRLIVSLIYELGNTSMVTAAAEGIHASDALS
jgi:hypothetical protein